MSALYPYILQVNNINNKIPNSCTGFVDSYYSIKRKIVELINPAGYKKVKSKGGFH